jgi:hypothetical protein
MPFRDDLNLNLLDWETKVELGSIGTVQSYQDLAPLLDEFSKRFYKLSAHVSSFEPPAAGFSEIAVSLTWMADTAKDHPLITYAALRFIDTILEDSARKIRKEIARITREGRANRNGRRFVPIEINIGPVKFLFHRPVDESELTKQVEAMKETLAVLPSGTFLATRKGQFDHWYFWDNELECWRMVAEEVSGWWPHDIWDDK